MANAGKGSWILWSMNRRPIPVIQNREQTYFTILHVAPQRICPQVCKLDHTRQAAIDKERRFNNALEESTLCEDFIIADCAQMVRMLKSDRHIVVVNEKTELAYEIS